MAVVVTVTGDTFIITIDEVQTLVKDREDILCIVDPLDTTVVQIFETTPNEAQKNIIFQSKYTNFATPSGASASAVCTGINLLLVNGSPLNVDVPHCFLSTNSTQTIADITTGQVIPFDVQESINNVTHSVSTNPSRIYIDYEGSYTIHMEAIVSSSSASKEAYFWLRVDGSDVVRSNNQISLVNASDTKAATLSWHYYFTVGQYFQVMFGGNSTAITLPYISTTTNPTRPVTPSVNLLVELI